MGNDNHLKKTIEERKVIELDMFDGEMYQDGICIKSNEHLWIMINYDRDIQNCNGITILRNKDVDNYSVYKKKYFLIPKHNKLYDQNRYSWLKSVVRFRDVLSKLLETKEIVALFTELESYYVGVITKITNESINVKLISTDGLFIDEIVFDIDKVLFLSFNSEYEKSLYGKIKGKEIFGNEVK